MSIPIPQELTERIVIKNVEPPYNAATHEGTVDSTYCNAYARITERSGIIEETDQQHISASQGFEVWTQYDSGITGFMEIKWGSRTLTQTEPPQKIMDVNNRHWTVMQCREVTEKDFS